MAEARVLDLTQQGHALVTGDHLGDPTPSDPPEDETWGHWYVRSVTPVVTGVLVTLVVTLVTLVTRDGHDPVTPQGHVTGEVTR